MLVCCDFCGRDTRNAFKICRHCLQGSELHDPVPCIEEPEEYDDVLEMTLRFLHENTES